MNLTAFHYYKYSGNNFYGFLRGESEHQKQRAKCDMRLLIIHFLFFFVMATPRFQGIFARIPE